VAERPAGTGTRDRDGTPPEAARALAVLVGFARLLRERGLPVGGGRMLAFCQAAAALVPLDAGRLYWAGRSTLVASRADIDLFDRTFNECFGGEGAARAFIRVGGDPEALQAVAERLAAELPLLVAGVPVEDEAPDGEHGATAAGLVASATEVLHNRSFSELDEAERLAAQAAIRRLDVRLPTRRARRLRAAPGGRQLDLRRTLRGSLRTQGEPLRRAWRARVTRPRSLVLVLDVSGSMSSYARALLQFGFAAIAVGGKADGASRGTPPPVDKPGRPTRAGRVEVFCFGTRLTRITRALRARDPDAALQAVAARVVDWDGGTRIGDSLERLVNRYGQHAFLRGAVVVVCSDGLDRGDPAHLARQMARLSRLSHRVVWVNPLKGDPRYQPLARGMAAALPYVDVFLPGHNVASLAALGEALRRRGRSR
jgi:uncharacterized protein with von Willebrand factor type A (vWA) domain